MSIEKNITATQENDLQRGYMGMVFFDADDRFSKADLDIWPEGKFDKVSYKEKLKSLEERGFQEYLPHVTLTKTVFQPGAKFETVQDKDPKVEIERVTGDIETETEKKWQIEVITETYDQNQKKMRIFIREKYGRRSLVEMAEEMKGCLKEGVFLKAEKEDNFIFGVYGFLNKGDIDRARAEFEGQYDKFVNFVELDRYLSDAMYDDEVLSPKSSREKWRKSMLSDE